MRILFALLVFSAVAAGAYSIPKEQVDEAKIHFGAADTFEKPAAVDIVALMKATPEYEMVRKKKIKTGSGEFHTYVAKAGARANRAIKDFAEDSEYDLIASAEYLESLDPPIEAEDITESIIEVMGEELNRD